MSQLMEPIKNVDALQNLRAIHLPQPVSIWPLAPGWYPVIIIAILFASYGCWRFWRYRNRLRQRRAALQLVSALERDFQPQIGAEIMSELSQLLKRLAFYRFSREKIAKLKGDAWLNFLAETANLPEFKEGAGRYLLSAPYARTVPVECREIFPLVKRWIELNL